MSDTQDLKSPPQVNGNSSNDTSNNDNPVLRPLTPGPGDSKTRTEVAKKQLRNLKPTMVSQSVNKTALHPGGVE